MGSWSDGYKQSLGDDYGDGGLPVPYGGGAIKTNSESDNNPWMSDYAPGGNYGVGLPFDNEPAENYIQSVNPITKVADFASETFKTIAGNEAYSKVAANSAMTILAYLNQRRKEKATAEENEKTRNFQREAIARGSAVPTQTSVVKPGVTGKQFVGTQRQQPQGLIGATYQRSAR